MEGNPTKKRTFSAEHCANISRVQKGTQRTPLAESTRKKISASLRERSYDYATCYHCGMQSTAPHFRSIEGLEEKVECVRVQSCERRIVASWGRVS